MRKLLLLVMMCVYVPIGALAAVYEMKDYGWPESIVVATLSVDGGVATIEFTGNGDASNFDTSAMGNSSDGITEVVVKGTIPDNVSNSFLDYFNNANHGVLQNCTRMDFSQATGKLPSSVHGKVNGVILPNGKSFSDVSGGNYIIIANDDDSEENAVEVCVKNGTDWANDPIVQDASYLMVYGSDGTNYLEDCAELRALNQTKWVNGEPAKQVLEDLTINATEQDEQEVLTNFLVTEGKVIKNLTVSGELSDLSIFDDINVMKDVDFSGITNTDLSELKLPSTTGTIKLPGGSYKEGIVTLADDYTQDQLKNIVAALKGSGKSVNEIIFPGGSVYNPNTKALEVTTDDEDNGKLFSIAKDLRNADLDIESVKLEKYGTSWKGETMTLPTSSSAQEDSQKTLLSDAGFPVTKVKKTSYPDIEVELVNGVLTITSYREGALQEMLNSSDEEANAYKALIQDNSAKGEGSKLVLVGPFKADDLSKLTEINNQSETVDMSEATFSTPSDMKFTYWNNSNSLKHAVTSNYLPDDYKVGKSNGTFDNCKQLVSVKFNSGIADGVANNASDVPNLTTIKIGANVTEISDNAFQNITSITTLDASAAENLTVIGSYAFSGCSSFSGDGHGKFHVPNCVQTIETSAFEECLGIVDLYFDAKSQINSIESRAFWMASEGQSSLKNVYINVSPAGEIQCAKGAFDKTNCCNQTQVGTVRVRLHYPREFYEYYVGAYKDDLYDPNLDYRDENGNVVHAYGVITHDVIDRAYGGAQNGWQEFMSSGIPVGKSALYRTYSEAVAYLVPDEKRLQVYLVHNYDKDQNVAICVQMKEGDLIPANTGIIIHSEEEATVYLPYSKTVANPYNHEDYPNNKYRIGGQGEGYDNYLKPINGTLQIDNVEIVNGQKTYRNYFFNNGTTAASRPGPDWKEEYAVLGWGFFRAKSKEYTVWNKAFLHLPAEMTNASSTILDDSGNLPQDQQGDSGAKSFGMYIIGLDESSETTPVERVFVTNENGDGYYTLQGVRVNTPANKGIYIHNGKKVVVK